MPKTYPNPQYLIVNKVPSGGNRGTKFFWDPKKIESIKAEAIDEIREVIGADGSPTRRLGFCFIIPYLEKNVDSEVVLQRILEISSQKKFPVLVKLDGISWWETRSDLWNFWGAVEWFLFKRKKGISVREYWRETLRKVLNYRNNKILAIYNWEAISTRPMVIKAIKEVMQEAP